MRVCSGPGIVRQVEAGVIRILIDNDRISIPNPIRDIGEVVRENAKVGAPEPESAGAAAFETEDMTGSEAQREVSVLPGMIYVIVPIVTSHIVTNPLTVAMHVRGVRMSLEIAEIALISAPLSARALLRLALVRGTLFWSALLLHGVLFHGVLFLARR